MHSNPYHRASPRQKENQENAALARNGIAYYTQRDAVLVSMHVPVRESSSNHAKVPWQEAGPQEALRHIQDPNDPQEENQNHENLDPRIAREDQSPCASCHRRAPGQER